MSNPLADLPVPPECREMIRAGALVVINHSGGKDSQTMTILLSRLVPHDQLIVVHAPLGEVEWPGTIEHIENTIPPGVPLVMAPVASGKTLLERIEERGRFPSKSARFCTSDLKRGPIERELRRYLKAHPRFEGRLVNALGIRRDESRDRARRIPWRRNERMSVAGREVFDWLPVFELKTEDVFRVIAEAGQSPHPVYSFGLTRCSCSFCIFASRSDLRRAAELRPELYAKYAQLERRIAHTLSPTRKYLPELTGIPVDSAVRTPLRPRSLKGDCPAQPRPRSVSS
ncbi:MAG: phosphoadenosine phosphosulfate reductase family protein [Rhodospirillaceae bacterium]|nr:phosphoadenosine phosphosulfate reductase family protein [Rhodospirillaceae bacterium]